jgi:hypothetical protein
MFLAFMPARALRIALALAVSSGLGQPSFGTEAIAALDADLSVEGMTFVSSVGPQNDAIVEAERAGIARTERVARLSGVHARVGKAAGARSDTTGGLELRCERGSFDLASGDLTAEGNVSGVTGDGRRFETQRVVYHRASGRVSTHSPVVIRDDFGTIRGSGFEYWVRENRFRLIGGASVEQGR